ncbi:MAG: DUF1178 family protein [Rhodospirillales bacterium]
MIVFDLRCDDGHRFESWFPSGAAFDRQQAEGAIECPLCGSHAIAKAPMAPRVASRSVGPAEEQRADGPESAPDSEDADAMRKALSRLRRHIEQNCDYVGSTFAEEARRIFYGETERRDIYGEASRNDAAELREEGIAVQQIPWIHRRDD